MIQNVHIQNFRCFEEFKIDGFARMNLIGGKNNAGKTCLLEAIACLSNMYNPSLIPGLRNQEIFNLFNINSKTESISITSKQDETDLEFWVERLENMDFKLVKSSLAPIHFFTQKTELPKVDIVNSFDNLDLKLVKEKMIQVFQIVDSRIEDLRTFKSRDGLWIKTQNKEYEPLDNYGDAVKNLMRYFIPIFEKELLNSDTKALTILLIDEIENGLHYSAQEEFWENIFKLSQQLNVQVFATTHSREMILAFNTVALQNGEGAYFEMARDIDTGAIFAQKHDMDLLQYELEAPKSTFRGE